MFILISCFVFNGCATTWRGAACGRKEPRVEKTGPIGARLANALAVIYQVAPGTRSGQALFIYQASQKEAKSIFRGRSTDRRWLVLLEELLLVVDHFYTASVKETTPLPVGPAKRIKQEREKIDQ